MEVLESWGGTGKGPQWAHKPKVHSQTHALVGLALLDVYKTKVFVETARGNNNKRRKDAATHRAQLRIYIYIYMSYTYIFDMSVCLL